MKDEIKAKRIEKNYARLSQWAKKNPDRTDEARAYLRQQRPVLRSTSLRIPEPVLDRLDALIPWLETQQRLVPSGKISQAEALRLVLVRGIDVLEKARYREEWKARKLEDK